MSIQTQWLNKQLKLQYDTVISFTVIVFYSIQALDKLAKATLFLF